MSIIEGTVDLSCDFDCPAGIVFSAWSDEFAQLIWGDPGDGWSMTFDSFRFALGETDICRFGPTGGPQYVNENRYLVIEPNRRVVYSTSLAVEGRITFAGTVCIVFDGTSDTTHMRLIEQGLYFDGHDTVESHRAGWAGMLDSLTQYLRR